MEAVFRLRRVFLREAPIPIKIAIASPAGTMIVIGRPYVSQNVGVVSAVSIALASFESKPSPAQLIAHTL